MARREPGEKYARAFGRKLMQIEKRHLANDDVSWLLLVVRNLAAENRIYRINELLAMRHGIPAWLYDAIPGLVGALQHDDDRSDVH